MGKKPPNTFLISSLNIQLQLKRKLQLPRTLEKHYYATPTGRIPQHPRFYQQLAERMLQHHSKIQLALEPPYHPKKKKKIVWTPIPGIMIHLQ